MNRGALVLLASLVLGCAGSHAATKPAESAQGAEPNAADAARRIPLEGALNARDLGGLGGVPRERFIRTADLSKATEADKATLAARHVALDIDLRSPDEVAKRPDALASDPRFHYVNLPMMGTTAARLEDETSLADLYIRMLAEHPAEIRQVFDAIATQADGAVLYHCAAGKDRTGMVSAMLLSLGGVDRDAIIHDYAISASYIGPMIEWAKKEKPQIVRLMGTPPADMARFLDALQTQYGGARAYLAKIGVSEGNLLALETRLGHGASGNASSN